MPKTLDQAKQDVETKNKKAVETIEEGAGTFFPAAIGTGVVSLGVAALALFTAINPFLLAILALVLLSFPVYQLFKSSFQIGKGVRDKALFDKESEKTHEKVQELEDQQASKKAITGAYQDILQELVDEHDAEFKNLVRHFDPLSKAQSQTYQNLRNTLKAKVTTARSLDGDTKFGSVFDKYIADIEENATRKHLENVIRKKAELEDQLAALRVQRADAEGMFLELLNKTKPGAANLPALQQKVVSAFGAATPPTAEQLLRDCTSYDNTRNTVSVAEYESAHAIGTVSGMVRDVVVAADKVHAAGGVAKANEVLRAVNGAGVGAALGAGFTGDNNLVHSILHTRGATPARVLQEMERFSDSVPPGERHARTLAEAESRLTAMGVVLPAAAPAAVGAGGVITAVLNRVAPMVADATAANNAKVAVDRLVGPGIDNANSAALFDAIIANAAVAGTIDAATATAINANANTRALFDARIAVAAPAPAHIVALQNALGAAPGGGAAAGAVIDAASIAELRRVIDAHQLVANAAQERAFVENSQALALAVTVEQLRHGGHPDVPHADLPLAVQNKLVPPGGGGAATHDADDVLQAMQDVVDDIRGRAGVLTLGGQDALDRVDNVALDAAAAFSDLRILDNSLSGRTGVSPATPPQLEGFTKNYAAFSQLIEECPSVDMTEILNECSNRLRRSATSAFTDFRGNDDDFRTFIQNCHNFLCEPRTTPSTMSSMPRYLSKQGGEVAMTKQMAEALYEGMKQSADRALRDLIEEQIDLAREEKLTETALNIPSHLKVRYNAMSRDFDSRNRDSEALPSVAVRS